MRKIIKRILQSLVFLLPVVVLIPSIAFAIPGWGAGVTDCVVWREGMPLPTTAPGFNGKGYCPASETTNRRIYELEVAVDALIIQNTRLQAQVNALQGIGSAPTPAITPTFDLSILTRLSSLELSVSGLLNKPIGKAILGCDKRTTGFSVTTGQSCIGNIPKK